MAKKYPRVGSVFSVRPQGKCFICNEIEVNGKRPSKRIDIQWDIFRGNDSVFKAHDSCIHKKTFSEILDLILRKINENENAN